MVRIGITLGDVTGIGPEVVVKALAQEPLTADVQYQVIGDAGWLERARRRWTPDLGVVSGSDVALGQIGLWQPGVEPLPGDLSCGSPVAARAAVCWLRAGTQRCLQGELDALVTGPVSKAAIVRSGQPFVGQTEYLSELSSAARTAMMLLGTDSGGRWLRVTLATTHVPLRQVADRLSAAGILQAIELAAAACEDLRLERRRIAVCGLNPHAGEGGNLGDEEERLIEPALEQARARGLDVTGPLAADTVFHQALAGGFEVVVAMYHDQGLGPLKLVALDTGVNWTLGLPFIRTSPDHGTAYDIAGQGVANPSSLGAALRLARVLAERRRGAEVSQTTRGAESS